MVNIKELIVQEMQQINGGAGWRVIPFTSKS
ncbi:hypothetical protein IGI53_002777 [Enterococcus sp. DIV0788_1]